MVAKNGERSFLAGIMPGTFSVVQDIRDSHFGYMAFVPSAITFPNQIICNYGLIGKVVDIALTCQKKGARSVIIQLPMMRNWTVSWDRLGRYLAQKALEEYLPLLQRTFLCPNASAVTIPVLLVSPSDG